MSLKDRLAKLERMLSDAPDPEPRNAIPVKAFIAKLTLAEVLALEELIQREPEFGMTKEGDRPTVGAYIQHLQNAGIFDKDMTPQEYFERPDQIGPNAKRS